MTNIISNTIKDAIKLMYLILYISLLCNQCRRIFNQIIPLMGVIDENDHDYCLSKEIL